MLTMASSSSAQQNEYATKGKWSSEINFSGVVPAAAANLPNGNILVWSAWSNDEYRTAEGAQAKNQTQTAIYNPSNGGSVTKKRINTSGHDMFCPGTANLPDGRIMITGGSTNNKTTLYNPGTNVWSPGKVLITGRGYHSQVTMSDGRNFTIGGSWSGGRKDKVAEIWSDGPAGWMTLPGIESSNSIAINPYEDGAPDDPTNKNQFYRTDNPCMDIRSTQW